MNHSKPLTPLLPADHITAYARVVQGSRKKPRKGTNQLSKARLNMSLKIHSANSARRGEIRAKRTTKQPMGARYPHIFGGDNHGDREERDDERGLDG